MQQPRQSREKFIQYSMEAICIVVVFLLLSTLIFDDYKLTLLGTVCFFAVYRCLCKDRLWQPSFRSTGQMRLAEAGDIDGIRRELAKSTLSLQLRDNQLCTLLQ
jgi:hypothetical protein